ncbi:MAG: hypothetical protein ACJ797_10325 [Ktedonobacteraceae bacterium]
MKAERIGCRGRFIVPIADLSALATFLVRLLLFHTPHPYHTMDRLAKPVYSRGILSGGQVKRLVLAQLRGPIHLLLNA